MADPAAGKGGITGEQPDTSSSLKAMAPADLSQRSIGSTFGGSPVVSKEASGRMVPEEELKAERQRWLQQCMHEVWNLENAAFERINNQIQDAAARIESDVTRAVLQRVDEEREERVAALARMRGDLQAMHGLEATIAAVRSDVSAVRAEFSEAQSVAKGRHEELEILLSRQQADAERWRVQLLAAESQINDLRVALDEAHEQQELRNTTMASELRQELTAMQMSQIEQLQEQTSRTASDLGRSLHEAVSAADAAQQPLKAELQQLRGELEKSATMVQEQASQIRQADARSNDAVAVMDEVRRNVSELRQDQLSESTVLTVLRDRLETAVNDRQEAQSQLEAIQSLVKEEQGRRSAEVASVASKLEAVETRLVARMDGLAESTACIVATAAQQPPTLPLTPAAKEVVDSLPELTRRVEAMEKQLASGGGLEVMGSLSQLVRRVEATEMQLAGGSTADVADTVSGLVRRMDAAERRIVESRSDVNDSKSLGANISLLAKRIIEVDSRAAQATDSAAAALAAAKAVAQIPSESAQSPAPAEARAGQGELNQWHKELQATQQDITKLSKDLENERRDRCRALADIEKSTEEVAKAAATALERAEQRLAGSSPMMANVAIAALGSGASGVEGSPAAGVPQRLSLGGVTSPSSGEEDRRNASSLSSSSFARLIGEMDAELRIELTSRVKLLTAELRGDLLREVAVRVGDVEAKVSAAEVSTEAKLQRIAGEISSRLSRLESIDIAGRMSTLENEGRRCSTSVDLLLEEAIVKTGGSTTQSTASSSAPRLQPCGSGGSKWLTEDWKLERGVSPLPGHPLGSSTTEPVLSDAAGGLRSRLNGVESTGSQGGGASSKELPSSLKQSLESLVLRVNRALNSKSESPPPPARSPAPANPPGRANSSLLRSSPKRGGAPSAERSASATGLPGTPQQYHVGRAVTARSGPDSSPPGGSGHVPVGAIPGAGSSTRAQPGPIRRPEQITAAATNMRATLPAARSNNNLAPYTVNASVAVAPHLTRFAGPAPMAPCCASRSRPSVEGIDSRGPALAPRSTVPAHCTLVRRA